MTTSDMQQTIRTDLPESTRSTSSSGVIPNEFDLRANGSTPLSRNTVELRGDRWFVADGANHTESDLRARNDDIE